MGNTTSCCRAGVKPETETQLEEVQWNHDMDEETAQFSRKEEARRLAQAQEEEERRIAQEKEAELQRLREQRAAELKAMLEKRRAEMLGVEKNPKNRYGTVAELPEFDLDAGHVPVLGLINPRSGAGAGSDILEVCRGVPYYQRRFFNILQVVDKGKWAERGSLMDVFRQELVAAVEEARSRGLRVRVVSGGGDGTASFATFLVFAALRANEDRADEGLADTGNGFIWTDQQLEDCFPALAQMPLGSANDFANILGWGQKYPGSPALSGACGALPSLEHLQNWFQAVIDAKTVTTNFDVWGILPADGASACNFKICELDGPKGNTPKQHVDGKKQLCMKPASLPVPFFVCLYFSVGYQAYVAARFQLNRHETPFKNRAEYGRQAIGIVLESTPPQLPIRIDGVRATCEGEDYFPPRQHLGNLGRGYRDVGFYNINWQGHLFHGANRGSVRHRMFSSREPVNFNDGLMDMFRFRLSSVFKNPGLRIQTDKKKDMTLKVRGSEGKGVFFQYDGETRFAFSPSGEDFSMYVRRVLSLPVVLGPRHNTKLTGNVVDSSSPVRFQFVGDSPGQVEQVRQRILANLSGDLERELNATEEEIKKSRFHTTPATIIQQPDSGALPAVKEETDTPSPPAS